MAFIAGLTKARCWMIHEVKWNLMVVVVVQGCCVWPFPWMLQSACFFFFNVVFWFFWGRVSLYVHILCNFVKNCSNVNRTSNQSVLNKRSGCWCHTPANKGRRVWLWQCWELAGVWGCVCVRMGGHYGYPHRKSPEQQATLPPQTPYTLLRCV